MFNFVYALFDTVKSTGTLGELNPGKEMGIMGIGILCFVFLFVYFVYAFRKIRDYIREQKSKKNDEDERE